MARVLIKHPVIAGGAPQKRGAIIEATDTEARLLIASGRAELADDDPMAVVVTEPAKPKRRGRPKKAKAAAPAAATESTEKPLTDGGSSV